MRMPQRKAYLDELAKVCTESTLVQRWKMLGIERKCKQRFQEGKLSSSTFRYGQDTATCAEILLSKLLGRTQNERIHVSRNGIVVFPLTTLILRTSQNRLPRIRFERPPFACILPRIDTQSSPACHVLHQSCGRYGMAFLPFRLAWQRNKERMSIKRASLPVASSSAA